MNEVDMIIRIQHALSSPFGRSFTGAIARWLIYAYLPLLLVLRKVSGLRDVVVAAFWSALFAFALSSALAAIVGRVRPYMSAHGVLAVVPPNIQEGSFPSSHTAIACAIAVSLLTVNVPIGIVAGVCACMVAFGRIAAGMHYPTDIVGGLCIGIIAALIVRYIQQGMEYV